MSICQASRTTTQWHGARKDLSALTEKRQKRSGYIWRKGFHVPYHFSRGRRQPNRGVTACRREYHVFSTRFRVERPYDMTPYLDDLSERKSISDECRYLRQRVMNLRDCAWRCQGHHTGEGQGDGSNDQGRLVRDQTPSRR